MSLDIFDKLINYYQNENDDLLSNIPSYTDEEVPSDLVNKASKFIKTFDISKFNYDEGNSNLYN